MAKTLATFRVDENDWEAFKDWAESQGSNASAELNRFILKSLRRLSNDPDTQEGNLDYWLERKIDKAIAQKKELQSFKDEKPMNNKSSVTSKSISIAARIPLKLHAAIEAYGMERFPSSDGFEKTATLIDLIEKGLRITNQNDPIVDQDKILKELEALSERIDDLEKLPAALAAAFLEK